MSGITTTGSTVLTGLDSMAPSLNMWRAALHWFGGMGIIVLAVAILPLLGVGGMQLYKAETPGAVKNEKLTPRITQTARALWVVYLLITLACLGQPEARRHELVRRGLPRLLDRLARRLLELRREHRQIRFGADRDRARVLHVRRRAEFLASLHRVAAEEPAQLPAATSRPSRWCGCWRCRFSACRCTSGPATSIRASRARCVTSRSTLFRWRRPAGS